MAPSSSEGLKCEPWNMWELKAPLLCTVKTTLHFNGVEDMKNILSSAITTLSGVGVLHKEAAMLSRFLYKFKRLFRQDKGLQHLAKINQCLHRYLRLNILGTFEKFKACLPSKLPRGSSHTFLPTQQMLKWVLLRILALSKIFLRIIDTSKEAGKYIYARLCLGWSALYMTLGLGLISRILVCAKFMLANAIEWYNGLRLHLPILHCTMEYVESYQFPENLKEFIGDVDLTTPSKRADIDKIFELIDLTVMNDDDEDDVIITNEIELHNIDDDFAEIIYGTAKNVKKSAGDQACAGLSVMCEKPSSTRKDYRSCLAKVWELEDLGRIIKKKKKRKNSGNKNRTKKKKSLAS